MTEEKTILGTSGWGWLVIDIVLYAIVIWLLISGIVGIAQENRPPWIWIPGGVTLIAAILVSIGFYVIQPNQAAALLLFGDYKGTVKNNGFKWRNPFMTVKKISLRARNLNGEKLKVNDQTGNPIEIAAVVVWKVENTAQALFEVDDYEEYVDTQSEAAIRHLAGRYPYDTEDEIDEGQAEVISLRQGRDEVNEELSKELQERLGRAGVVVQEARISHLAYAPEIAGAMLRRQQAQAVIAARKKIVEGAVTMVEMALHQLSEKQVVALDEERKASMVSNLLVVLCGEESAQPVVNTGTLYN
ncbi:MAG: SPFH domain-containing protein [Candidatus Omnitrophica bacterium]|nr:SPFH domain-containing protein [Candidatus Omnitrophota bacterium]